MDVVFSLDEIDAVATNALAAIGNRRVLAFHGEMGAGKTTFIHALCEVLMVKDAVSSPTFSIINQYEMQEGGTVFHMDLYRLKDEEEAIAAGVEDALYSGDFCLVEWPEKAPRLFPENTAHCFLEPAADNKRKLTINL
ncbi:MAG: hydrolase [Ferruginibacter sp.]|nr:hydrolase [Ferruginibacter sp.]